MCFSARQRTRGPTRRTVHRELVQTIIRKLIVVRFQNKPSGMISFGRGGGDRTHDLRLKRPLLYH